MAGQACLSAVTLRLVGLSTSANAGATRRALRAELDGEPQPLLRCDLKPHLTQPLPTSLPVGDGNQSLVVAALYRAKDSWVASFSLLPQSQVSWGTFLPDMRGLLGRLPGFPVEKLQQAPPAEADKVSMSAEIVELPC